MKIRSLKRMKTRISNGNTKLPKIPNVSLTPIKSCRNGVPCAKRCYAMKAYRCYKTAKTAWNNNLDLAKTDHEQFFADIDTYLSKKQPKFFRWHVAGDILSQSYLSSMIDIAIDHPGTRFLAFTKRYDLVNNHLRTSDFPDNLSIILSAWPGYPMDNPFGLPVAWCNDGNEDRVPKSALNCPGYCDTCGMCWDLARTGMDVVFDIH